LETKPSGIVLTGNLYPARKILTKAAEKKVPILLVPYDTFTTVEMLRELHGKVTARSLLSKDKIVKSVLSESVNIERLLDAI
jgi:hypothetical protein